MREAAENLNVPYHPPVRNEDGTIDASIIIPERYGVKSVRALEMLEESIQNLPKNVWGTIAVGVEPTKFKGDGKGYDRFRGGTDINMFPSQDFPALFLGARKSFVPRLEKVGRRKVSRIIVKLRWSRKRPKWGSKR
jgi:hypothetical protein